MQMQILSEGTRRVYCDDTHEAWILVQLERPASHAGHVLVALDSCWLDEPMVLEAVSFEAACELIESCCTGLRFAFGVSNYEAGAELVFDFGN